MVGSTFEGVMANQDRSLASADASRRRLPVGPQTLAAIGVLLAVLAASIAVAVVSIVSLNRDRAVLHEANVPYAVAIATAALNAKGMANDERGYLISGKPEFLELLDQHLLNVRTAFAAAASAADRVSQHDAVEQAHARFEQWVSAIQGQFRAYQAGNREAATTAALGPGLERRKSYEAALVDAEAAGVTAIPLRGSSLASTGWVAIFFLSILLAVGICVGLAAWLMRTLKLAPDEDGSSKPSPAAIPVPASSVRGLRSPR